MSPVLHDVSGAPPGPFIRKSRYILVVEGNTEDLFTTSILLQRFSYAVCTARNARQALDLVAVAVPALVIADHDLHGMSGLDLLRILGSNARTFAVPVVLLTPPGDADLDNKGMEVGGAFLLQKPVAVEELYRSVQAAMESTPRTNIRVSTALPVTINNRLLNGKRGECAINLSVQGAFIRTFRYYRPGETISVKLILGDHAVRADATILYSHRQDEGPVAAPGIAVKFKSMIDEDREMIRRFINSEVTRGITSAEEHPAAEA
jgi:DNA-binding response OmpR family regulator